MSSSFLQYKAKRSRLWIVFRTFESYKKDNVA